MKRVLFIKLYPDLKGPTRISNSNLWPSISTRITPCAWRALSKHLKSVMFGALNTSLGSLFHVFDHPLSEELSPSIQPRSSLTASCHSYHRWSERTPLTPLLPLVRKLWQWGLLSVSSVRMKEVLILEYLGVK